MTGALLALLSAATFGLNNAALRRGVLTGSVVQALAITVPLGVPMFALGVVLFGAVPTLFGLPADSIFWFSLAGAVHFVAGRFGNYSATQAMGANLSGPVQQMSILVSLCLALVFLGESLTPIAGLGIVLVLVGPIVMLQGRAKGRDRTPSGFEPRYRAGFFWGAVCALGYGSSPLFIAWGLSGRGLEASLAGGLVSYVAASVVVGVILLFPGQLSLVQSLGRTPARWFLLSGLFVFVSQMFRYMALAVAPVSVVVPVQRLSVVFRVLFSWLINRDHEIFGFWVLLGIAISTLGAALLTISIDWVATLLPPPFAAAAQWRWP